MGANIRKASGGEESKEEREERRTQLSQVTSMLLSLFLGVKSSSIC